MESREIQEEELKVGRYDLTGLRDFIVFAKDPYAFRADVSVGSRELDPCLPGLSDGALTFLTTGFLLQDELVVSHNIA